jgi:hypothetical protein
MSYGSTHHWHTLPLLQKRAAHWARRVLDYRMQIERPKLLPGQKRRLRERQAVALNNLVETNRERRRMRRAVAARDAEREIRRFIEGPLIRRLRKEYPSRPMIALEHLTVGEREDFIRRFRGDLFHEDCKRRDEAYARELRGENNPTRDLVTKLPTDEQLLQMVQLQGFSVRVISDLDEEEEDYQRTVCGRLWLHAAEVLEQEIREREARRAEKNKPQITQS